MSQSMTGFGNASLHDNGMHYLLEIRSLNNRYFKAVIKLPETLSVHEAQIEKHLRERLVRGSVTYTLRIRNVSAKAAYEVNTAAVDAYLSALAPLAKTNHGEVPYTIDLAQLATMPGVCQVPEPQPGQIDHESSLLKDMTDRALEALVQMRRREGAITADELRNHCRIIEDRLETVSTLAPRVANDYQQRLLQRVSQMLESADVQLKPEDVVREVSIYADRCDVSEEIIRLRSHVQQFCATLDKDDTAGRKLDFISQELLREANTIASKANDAEIIQAVVEIKTAVDRIKEQVQNLV